MKLMRDCAIRPFAEEDKVACLDIYEANRQRGFVPANYAAEFEANLGDRSFLTLVCTIQGRVVACGSVNYLQGRTAAWLSYGLVHPDFQRQGIGSTMVLMRMSLLEPAALCTVYLSATIHSRGFFLKHGFGARGRDGDAFGNEFETLYFPINSTISQSIRQALRRCGVRYDTSLQVPSR